MAARSSTGRAVAVPVVTAFLVVAGCSSDSGGAGGTAPAVPTPVATAISSASPSATASPRRSGPPRPVNRPAFRYQPLFPFGSAAEAAAWRRTAGQGHQPWHLDPGATALAFTRHLRLTGVDRVARTVVNGDDARVTVGYAAPGEAANRVFPAAVLHLVRLGSGASAPWEVVGTDDTRLSLTTPAYGARAAGTVTVGGRISGVDESIRVQAFGPASDTPLGTACCVSAGGDGTPWKTTLTLGPAPGTVVTIVASTGGHLAGVERFAVTAVHRA